MPAPAHSTGVLLFKSSAISRVPGLSASAGKRAILDAQKKAIQLLEQRLQDLDVWDEDTQQSFLT
jgi:hypothetical protein